MRYGWTIEWTVRETSIGEMADPSFCCFGVRRGKEGREEGGIKLFPPPLLARGRWIDKSNTLTESEIAADHSWNTLQAEQVLRAENVERVFTRCQTNYSVVQKKFPLFEIPASFLPSKMASPCTANWP